METTQQTQETNEVEPEEVKTTTTVEIPNELVFINMTVAQGEARNEKGTLTKHRLDGVTIDKVTIKMDCSNMQAVVDDLLTGTGLRVRTQAYLKNKYNTEEGVRKWRPDLHRQKIELNITDILNPKKAERVVTVSKAMEVLKSSMTDEQYQAFLEIMKGK